MGNVYKGFQMKWCLYEKKKNICCSYILSITKQSQYVCVAKVRMYIL